MQQISEVWETYRSCWNNSDSQRRTDRLNEIMTQDFEYRDPNIELKGHAQLSEYMEQFQSEFKGASFVVTDFKIHHNRSMAKWNMINEQNEVVGNGVDFAQYEDGKLNQINGFFEAN